MPIRWPAKRVYKREEQALVGAIIDYLTLKHIPHYRTTNSGTIIHRPGGKIIFGKKAVSQIGAPDILAWHKGKAYAVEVKSPTGKLSNEQIEWLERFTRIGEGVAVVARSMDIILSIFH